MNASPKLSKAENAERKTMKNELEANNGALFSFPDLGVTVAVTPAFQGSEMVHFSVAMAAADEPKFRRKVGEWYALHRMNEGVVTQVRWPDYHTAGAHEVEDKAHELAYFVSN